MPIEDGGSGLVSTANDYLKFATMLLNKGSFNGKRILNPETVEIMTSNQVEKKAKPYKLDAWFWSYCWSCSKFKKNENEKRR